MKRSNINSKYNVYGFILAISLVGLSKLVSLSFIVGSMQGFFSGVNVTGPLTVVFGGLSGGLLFMAMNVLLCVKSFSLLSSTGIPTFIAGLYWNSNSKFFKISLPALCMALFWVKTFGTLGSAYALLWLIPIGIEAFNLNSLIFKSLGSTFVAHAVGSLIWLYFANLTSTQWFSLIPVVLVERLSLAAMTYVCYLSISYVVKKIQSSVEGKTSITSMERRLG